MKFLKSYEITRALLNLNDRVCSFERDTGRKYTLILIPHSKDEDIQISQDGKPIPDNITPQQFLELALQDRE